MSTGPVDADAAGFVLAGGRSSRMGRDKALVELGGHPLIEHSVGILRAAGLKASIAGGDPLLARFAPLVPDLHAGLGPLSGVCNALASTSAQWAVFVSVDAPFLPALLLRALLLRAQHSASPVSLCSINGFAQTFPAVIDRVALPYLVSELEAGGGGCFAAFQAAAAALGGKLGAVPAEVLAQCGQVTHPQALPPVCWFMNVNTPQELRRAERQLKARAIA